MKIENKIEVTTLSAVPETMLIPLYFKAKETNESGIIKDNVAVEILKRINYDFSKMDNDWIGQISVCVNTFLIDNSLNNLLKENGNQVIVNLGSGLDTRQERFSDFKWYHLDLPQSIAIRKKVFNENKGTSIEKSILDATWVNEVKEKENIIFIAEGLFMYFTDEEVKSVLNNIRKSFTNSHIIFDTLHKELVGTKRYAKSVNTSAAPFKFGISSIDDIIKWNTGWKQEHVFYKIDYYKKRWKWLRWFSFISSFKKGFIVAVLKSE